MADNFYRGSIRVGKRYELLSGEIVRVQSISDQDQIFCRQDQTTEYFSLTESDFRKQAFAIIVGGDD